MASTSYPIFVINLAQAAERRARMAGLLQTLGLAHTFVTAVNGEALDEDAERFWQADPLRAKLNPGEIGCLLSHRAIWQRIVDEGLGGAIMLEDDLCLSEHFADIAGALRHLPERIGLLRLESDRRSVIIRKQASARLGGHGCYLMARSGPVGSGAYAINAQTARHLLAAAPRFTAPIDAELYCAARSSLPQLVTHQLVPPVCMQAQFDPVLAQDAPFLDSMIAKMGMRADQQLGFKPQRKTRLPGSVRRLLRPARRLIAHLRLAPRGWQRLQVESFDTPFA